jgi:hypothetical protein
LALKQEQYKVEWDEIEDWPVHHQSWI